MRYPCLAIACLVLAACHRGEHAPDAHPVTPILVAPHPSDPQHPLSITEPGGDAGPASAVATALSAITAAQSRGGTPCEQAYNGMVAMFQGLALPDGGRRMPPERARFVSACVQLPVQTQQCMVFTYAIAHQAECHALRGTMSPEDTARMRAVMTGH